MNARFEYMRLRGDSPGLGYGWCDSCCRWEWGICREHIETPLLARVCRWLSGALGRVDWLETQATLICTRHNFVAGQLIEPRSSRHRLNVSRRSEWRLFGSDPALSLAPPRVPKGIDALMAEERKHASSRKQRAGRAELSDDEFMIAEALDEMVTPLRTPPIRPPAPDIALPAMTVDSGVHVRPPREWGSAVEAAPAPSTGGDYGGGDYGGGDCGGGDCGGADGGCGD